MKEGQPIVYMDEPVSVSRTQHNSEYILLKSHQQTGDYHSDMHLKITKNVRSKN